MTKKIDVDFKYNIDITIDNNKKCWERLKMEEKRLEKITTRELISILQNSNFENNGEYNAVYFNTSPVVELNEDIWGMKNGIYRQLGRLQLPIQYSSARFKNDEDLEYVDYQLISVLNHDFFDGFVPKDDDGYIRPFIDGYIDRTDSRYLKFNLFIDESGEYDKISIQKSIGSFITKFFDMYKKRNDLENNEAQGCLNRAFIQYT